MFQITKQNNKKQVGFILPAAIFLLVFLALILGAIFTITKATSKATTFDVLDQKAFVVAKTGIEYGFFQAVKNASCSSTFQTVSVNSTDLVGFKFSYKCDLQTSNEAGQTFNFYKITSIGCNTTQASCPTSGTTPDREDYVEKSIVSMIYK